MYRQYKILPEGNKICMKAARERAYQQHLSALRNMKSSLDTKRPVIPQTLGRNYKRFENEKQCNAMITRDNARLLRQIESFQYQENYPFAPIQRPFTLQGQAQRDEMSRITHENHKLLNAVQQRQPILNRNEWLKHRLDHEYQLAKMSEFKKTVPMSEIIRREKRLFAKKEDSFQEEISESEDQQSSNVDLEEETQDRTNTLLGDDSNQEQNKQSNSENNKNDKNQGRLEEVNNSVANGLFGESQNKEEEKEEQNKQSNSENNKNNNDQGRLEEVNNSVANGLFGDPQNEKEEQNKQLNSENNKNDKNQGRLEEVNNSVANGLLGEPQNKEEENGVLEQQAEQITGSLLN